MKKIYYVYMMTNEFNTVIYTGMTNNLVRRLYEHRRVRGKGFTQQYRINKLVYYEEFETAYDAISREKQIKGGSRRKKVDLIDAMNPQWKEIEIN